MSFISAISRQPRRLTLSADSSLSTTAADYAIERADGGYSLVAAMAAWSIGINSVELSLSPALEVGIAYIATLGSDSIGFVASSAESASPPPAFKGEDPAAEAYGVDKNWLSGEVTADGDIVEVRGRSCLINDTLVVALVSPKEIYHRPEDGAGLHEFVNGPGNRITASLIQGRLKRQWLKDTRIAKVDKVEVLVDSKGVAKIPARLTEAVLNEAFDIVLPGGR